MVLDVRESEGVNSKRRVYTWVKISLVVCLMHTCACIIQLPDYFDAECVSMQLQNTGVLETVRIRKEGYSFRPQFEEFIERHVLLLSHL